MSAAELPVAIIRGGTSRGVFLRELDLPSDPTERQRRILRLFGLEGSMLADGLGGENPVLRKAAIVAPAEPIEDGITRVRYTFGQVDAALRTVEHTAECGNIAAGVPAFTVLHGWAPPPEVGARLRVELVNTGRVVMAEWLANPTTAEGSVRLHFLSPVQDRASALFSSAPQHTISIKGSSVQYSVVRAINDYLFVDARTLGMTNPAEVHEVGEAMHGLLSDLMAEVRACLPDVGGLKVCLVAPAQGREGAVTALIAYPLERRLHGSFAVTGAIALGVATCIEGTVPHELARLGDRTTLHIVHKSGTMSITLDRGVTDVPRLIGIDRTYRVLMRGVAP